MNLRGLINKLSFYAMAAIFVLMVSAPAHGQALYDSFSDGEFTTNPSWGGTTGTWIVVADSDAAAGAVGSNTVRLNVPTVVAGTEYLSSQISNFGTSQEWGVFIGRRNQAFTAANQQYFWLYANEANLTSATVDGYRLAIGDDAGGDNIRLEYIVNGIVSATVITSTGTIANGLTDIGFLVRVTRSTTGAFEIFTSTLPTTSGSGAIATDIPNAANANLSQGTGTNNSLVPAANGYIGLAALHSTSLDARQTAEFDQVYFSIVSPTAATATIGGRVSIARGNGLRNVAVMMTGGDLEQPITVYTGVNGSYQFPGVPVGQTYIIQVSARRYTFNQPTRAVGLIEDVTDVNFVGEPAGLKGGSVFGL